MKNCNFQWHPAALALAAAASCASSWAQVQPSRSLGESVVTATRSTTRSDELVSDVVVIDRATIDVSAARTVPELLARSAGLQMSANGGAGKVSAVFIRGTEARHVILLIDGVRYGSATAGTPMWDAVQLDMIDRIEVLKGPASALYGSEGAGGVVQIFTRTGRQGFHPYATATAGSQGLRQLTAGVSGGQGGLSYALGFQRKRESGFSATNSRVPFGNFNADKDPFDQDGLNASLAYRFNDRWSADAGLVYTDGVSHFDDGPGRDAQSAVRSLMAHAGVKGQLLPGWRSELSFGQSVDTANVLVGSFMPSDFKTQQDQWIWQNHIDSPLGVVLAGLEHRKQAVSGSTAYIVSQRSIDAAFLGLSGTQGRLSWQANARRDRNSQFGGAGTGFVGVGYRINPNWRLSASHGTSFVAPSFNQLYFPGFSNPLLQPERGRNTDLGLSWTAGEHEVKLVHFDNKIRGYMTNTTLPLNIPRSRIEGWTLTYEGRVGDFSLRASYDALDPRNELNGLQLPRRAKSQFALGVDWRRGDWRLGGTLLNVGRRFDDAANTAALAGYATLDLYADYAFARDWSVQAKFNNLTNRQYETALGYNQPLRGVFLTLRWQPK
ncbi:MAG: TonB-dependent receptor [Burkholderiaceae bacterium]|nr:TonB-dependent receptor [Burkholderiaceae bacterium]